MDTGSVEVGNLGGVAVLEGNLSEAEPLSRESLEMAYKRGDRYLAPYELIWLGRVALGQGNPTRPRLCLRRPRRSSMSRASRWTPMRVRNTRRHWPPSGERWTTRRSRRRGR